MNPYRAIIGKMPTRKEVNEWTPDKFIAFFRYLETFLENDAYKITKKKRETVEELMAMPDHPFQEFLWRMNLFADNKEVTDRKYFYKLNSFVLQVLTALKQNPSKVTEDMRAIMVKYPMRLGRALDQYKVVDTPLGEIVQRDTQLKDGYKNKQISMPSHEKMLMDALIGTISVYKEIVDSISKSDLKGMAVEDKISALAKLKGIFEAKRSMSGPRIFQQINVHSAKAEDMESALLDFAKKK